MNHIEQSQRNFFSSATIDRSARTLGDDALLTALMHDKRARFVPIWNDKVLVLKNTHGFLEKVSVTKDELSSRFTCTTPPIYLGHINKLYYFSAAVEPNGEDRIRFTDLRYCSALISDVDNSLLGYALTLQAWHKNYQYCGLCGSPNLRLQGGHILRCSNPECLRQHFPRTDPAIIVLVQYEDRALFGRKAEWPTSRYSTIAGFVEPGESAEQAVVREVAEETGIQVATSSYHSSQPWPFSSSLMLGYIAEAQGLTNIQLNDKELEDARWLSRKEIIHQLSTGKFVPPTSISISFRLIEDWFNRGNPVPFRMLCENNNVID